MKLALSLHRRRRSGDPDAHQRSRPAPPRSADVVVYDHRVHARLLRGRGRTRKRLMSARRRPGRSTRMRSRLLLVEKAREGKSVVRLKWGDPFVFDSGGKEALFLHEQGIPFEVVPGIPVAIGAPAYAGIPVTYPEAGDVLSWCAAMRTSPTRRRRSTGRGWPASTARSSATRARADRRDARRAALEHGRSPDEAAALIYDGTMPSQRTVVGTLATIADKRRARTAAACWSLARWSGCAITCAGSTSGRSSAAESSSRDRASRRRELDRDARGARRGSDPARLTIRIAPPDDPEALDGACAMAGTFDWIVFTSANAVDSLHARLLAIGDIRDLNGVRICAGRPVDGSASRGTASASI